MIDKIMFALIGFIPGFFVGVLFAVVMVTMGGEEDE